MEAEVVADNVVKGAGRKLKRQMVFQSSDHVLLESLGLNVARAHVLISPFSL